MRKCCWRLPEDADELNCTRRTTNRPTRQLDPPFVKWSAGGLLAAGQEYVGLAEIHFRGEPPILRSVDLIAFNPVSGGAQAERAIVAEDLACEDEAVICHDLGE